MNVTRIRFSAAGALALLLTGQVVLAEAQVVISQVYGGGGNSGATLTHDYVELFNRGAVAQDLSGWSVQYASTAGSTWQKTDLSGVLQPGQYYLVQQAQGAGGTVPLPTPDATGTIAMSATNGKVALVSNQTLLTCGAAPGNCFPNAAIVDFVGFGSANNFEGAAATGVLSNTTAALRAANGCTDTNNNGTDFAVGTPAPRNTATALNPCGGPPVDTAPAVASTTPANGATGVALDANVTVTFSEPVNVSGEWFGLSCSIGGPKAATVSGGPTLFTIDPSTNFATNEVCTLIVRAANVADQDTNDPPDTMAADVAVAFTTVTVTDPCARDFTPIYAIQGSGLAPAITGVVTTKGVVVGDYEYPGSGSTSAVLRGFFIQDATGDGDAATSDGIFVFNGNNNTVSLGDLVYVTGTAADFQDQTQIGSVTAIDTCGTGSVSPVDVTLPVTSTTFLERYEGMLVRLPQTLYVTEHFQLGRFGQVVLSSGDRLAQPTQVADPGAPALAVQAANNLNRIVLDDASQGQNPDPILFGRGGLPLSASNTLRGGDSVTGLVGVLTYTWGGNASSPNAYRVRPINALGGVVPNFVAVNARPVAAPALGGALRIASANLLNYYNTFTGCTAGVGGAALDCRGANNVVEFDRQVAKVVAALTATGADIIGLIEVEHDGYGPTSAIQDLVTRMNAVAGPGVWAFIDADAGTGVPNVLGTDGIKVALIYRTDRVTPVGNTAVLNTGAFGLFVLADSRIQQRNRPALAQTFEASTRQRVTVVVNHFISKGASCELNVSPVGPDPDLGDGQGACNLTRVAAAQELSAWLATDPTGAGDPDYLLVGDFNAYAKEDPLDAFSVRGFMNLLPALAGLGAYTYAFDGQWGALDHALVSASLAAQVAGVAPFHINADEPSVLDYNTEFKSAGQLTSLYAPDAFRTADHDPIVIGLNPCASLNGTVGRDVLVGTAAFECITGGVGGDTLTGGAGPDVFSYVSTRDTGDTLKDFVTGQDVIDFSVMLRSLGFVPGSSNPAAWVKVVASGANSIVQVDFDGPGTAYIPRSFLIVRSVAPAQLWQPGNFIF